MLLNKILNYTVRILLIIVGLSLLTGLLKPNYATEDQIYVMKIMGIIVTLFGIYRLVIYRTKYRNDKDNEDID